MVLHEAGITLVGPDVTPVQVETSAATIEDYQFPFGFVVLDWGVSVTEDFAAHAIAFVVKLQKLDKLGGTVTDISTLTIDVTNTNLKRGDGKKEGQTLVTVNTEIDNGHVIYGKRSNMPHYASTSAILRFAVSTATGSAGGAIVPFAFVKPLLDMRAATSWIDVS